MKRYIVILILFVSFGTSLYAEEQQIIQLLQNDDWIKRDKAVNMILRDFERYKDNDKLQHKLLETLVMENEKLRLHGNSLMFSREGHGEYYRALLHLVIKFDIPGSTELLIETAGIGKTVEDAIVKRLLKEGETNSEILRSIQKKLLSSDIFYRDSKSGYLKIIRKYLEKQPSMSQSKEALVKEIVLNGLLLYDEFAQRDAIECSEYFPELIPKVLQEFIRRATTEIDTEVRRSNIRVLAKLGDPSAIPVLAELLHDPEPRIRDMAAYALTQFQDASIVPLLIQALDNPDGHVRLRAAWHLGDIRATEAIPALKKLATDDPYLEEVDEQRAQKYGVYEHRDGKYFVYRVRYAAREALKLIEGIEPTPRPTPSELFATPVNTPVPSPQPTETPSPAPTETPYIHYRRSLTPLPTAPVPSSKPQEHAGQQVLTEAKSSPPPSILQPGPVIIVFVALVSGVIGYIAYRIKRHHK